MAIWSGKLVVCHRSLFIVHVLSYPASVRMSVSVAAVAEKVGMFLYLPVTV